MKDRISAVPLFLMLILIFSIRANVQADSPESPAKPRIVVMTDIGGDPDDQQSMVRFLLYACDFDVEGFCTGFGHGHDEVTRPDLIRDAVEAYGEVLPNLRLHRSDYPSAERLADLIKDGDNGDPHSVGPGRDSEASDWIIKVLDQDDPRPVWFTIWGGPRELAQAIWKVSQTRSPEELAEFKSKIRVHSIADQDRTAEWVKQNHPDIFWIYSNALFRGIWKEGDQELVSPEWLRTNVLEGHGALGPLYPPKASGKDGVKEGDTPSFLYVLDNGLSDPDHPEWGNWGGRFRRSGRGNEYLPAEDVLGDELDLLYSIHRWREAFQNAFEARMDWCVEPYDGANHEPTAVCNGDETRRVLETAASPRMRIPLSAVGSSDPDGDALRYHWRVYHEAGSYWGGAPIENDAAAQAVLVVPEEAAGRTIHVILEVVDQGEPPLTAYRRVILKVDGEPIEPPSGVLGVEEDLATPVTELTGPPQETGEWTFWRGVNINGPALEIDGNPWDGDDAADFVCDNAPLDSPHVALLPPADETRETMIHSFRWDRNAELKLLNVPRGEYAVYAYVWEETGSETITIRLNGQAVQSNYNTGPTGRWRRLGPWIADVSDGTITIDAEGGAANFSGLEIWRKTEPPQDAAYTAPCEQPAYGARRRLSQPREAGGKIDVADAQVHNISSAQTLFAQARDSRLLNVFEHPAVKAD